MATTNTNGKFTNTSWKDQETYEKTFQGATKIAGKLKFGGSENEPAQFVADAADLDWGGLTLSEISLNDTTLIATEITSDSQHDPSNLDTGIRSTGYLLNSISNSLKALQQKINDNATAIDDLSGDGETGASTLSSKISLLNTQVSELDTQVDNIIKELTSAGADTISSYIDKISDLKDKTIDVYVNDKITSKGYVTSTDVETQITNKGYVTSSDVDTQITNKGYVTSSDVDTQITNKGYATTTSVNTAISSIKHTTATVSPDSDKTTYVLEITNK